MKNWQRFEGTMNLVRAKCAEGKDQGFERELLAGMEFAKYREERLSVHLAEAANVLEGSGRPATARLLRDFLKSIGGGS